MKTRFVAAGSHFLASVFVISIFLSVVYFIWYPKPFYIIHSVFDAVKITIVVDLILGPFLTLVIFNVLKPRAELIRDISIIVLFQLVALSWGIHITHKMRPVFLVFQGDTFYSIIQKEIDVEGLSENVSLPTIWQQPESIYIEPLRGEEAIRHMDDFIKGKGIKGEMYQTKRYMPLSMQMHSKDMQDILNHATAYTVLLRSKTWKNKLKQFLESEDSVGEDYLFYSIENPGTYSGIIIYNKEDFSFAGLMD